MCNQLSSVEGYDYLQIGAEKAESKEKACLDNQSFRSPGSDTRSKDQCHRSSTAELDGGLQELASSETVGTLHEMCDPPTPTHKMRDHSFSKENSTSTNLQRQDPAELLDPINGEFAGRSLLQKILKMPALDPRYSTAKHTRSNLPRTYELGNRLSQIAREASMSDHLTKDRILVETDMFRESSDSSKVPTEAPVVQTVISSPPRPKSLDLNRPLPKLPQSNSLNLNRQLPPTPNDTEISQPRIGSSCRPSDTKPVHRFSCPDQKSMKCTPTDTFPDIVWPGPDTAWQSHSRREASRMNLRSTHDEVMVNDVLASKDFCEDPNRPQEQGNPDLIWGTVSPSTFVTSAKSSASNITSPASPASPNFEAFCPWSNMLSPSSPKAEVVPPPSNADFAALQTHEGLDMSSLEHYEDAEGGWISLSPSLPESESQELGHTVSSFITSESSLLIQKPVFHTAISSAFEAQWTKESTPERPVHAFSNHQFQGKELEASPVYTQPFHSKMKSFDLAGCTNPSAIDGVVESVPQSSMMKSFIHVDTSNSGSAVFLSSATPLSPRARNIRMDSSVMDWRTENLKAEITVSPLTPSDINLDEDCLDHLPLPVIDSNPPYTFSSPYPPETTPSVALWSRRQTNVPPLPLFRTNITSLDEENGKVAPSLQKTTTNPRSLTLDRSLAQIQGGKGEKSVDEVAHSQSDFSSAYQSSPNSADALLHRFDHPALFLTHLPPKQTQVEKLQGWIVQINDIWMQRLKSVPVLGPRCSALRPHTLVKKGFRALRECFYGRYVNTFEDVFAFMHLAFAAAFLLYDHQKFHCLAECYDEALFSDALQWQDALSDEEDKNLFLKAMDHLRCLPDPQSIPSSHSNRHKTLGSIITRQSLKHGDQTDLLNVLRNKEDFKACIGLLDGKLNLLHANRMIIF